MLSPVTLEFMLSWPNNVRKQGAVPPGLQHRTFFKSLPHSDHSLLYCFLIIIFPHPLIENPSLFFLYYASSLFTSQFG